MRPFKKLLDSAAKLLCVALLLSTVGAGCTQGPDAATAAASKKVEINVWGVIDDEAAYDAIFKDYRALHPNVTINFRRFTLEEYEDQLLNAMAEDRGPDIFMIHNTWVGKYMPKILPMPLQTKTALESIQGTLKKELVWTLVTQPTVSIRQFKLDYPDAVLGDMLRTVNVSTNPDKKDMQTRVVGIPLSVDTLAMYANKDLLNAAGISTVPQNWDDFQTAVKKLVKLDDQGNILQAGAGLGLGSNVERASDIIIDLMMQNGAEMSTADGTPTFTQIPAKLQGQRDVPPAEQALQFYTDFANPSKDVYTWNAKMPNSLNAFIQGKSAFFFGYGYDLPAIRTGAPQLNLGISQMPQITGNPVVNYANYWAYTVSKKTKNPDISWDLLNFMRKPEENKKFLDVAQRPAALRSQLNTQLDNEDIGVFASQVLTAQSWYRGNDPAAMNSAFVQLIEDAQTTDPEKYMTIINVAAEKVAQTIPSGGI